MQFSCVVFMGHENNCIISFFNRYAHLSLITSILNTLSKQHPLRSYNFTIQINFPGLFLFACVPKCFNSSVASAKQL